MVTPGFSEEHYQQARDMGVFFLRHTLAQPPEIDGKSVKVVDDVLGEELTFQPDLLVLSAGIVPNESYRLLADAMRLDLDEDGFFMPLHIKAQPMDLKRPGMYLAGSAGGPATLEETIEQGMGAALRAALFLRRGIKTPLTIASVDERICAGCGLCVEACPTGAREVDQDLGIAEVDPWLCLGCGVCVAVCPNGASSQAMHEARGVLRALDVALG
jgi:heterodisulfide reductase subunit A